MLHLLEILLLHNDYSTYGELGDFHSDFYDRSISFIISLLETIKPTT